MQSETNFVQQFSEEEEDQLSEFFMQEIDFKRVSTAPAKPLSDLGKFKRQKQFMILEQFVITSNQMIHKSYEKYDLDSEEGQKIFKRYLTHLENLCEHYKVETQSRQYRNNFSNAYKVLYKEGSLCYLTQIWDSAQQAFPYLWVNGQKYTFSTHVLQCGNKLVNQHFKLQHILKNAYTKIIDQSNQSLQSIKLQINSILKEFDITWTRYEQTYITQLMNIEKQARKLIVKAIQIERILYSIEIRERFKGRFMIKSQEYNNTRNKLIQIVCKINAVANTQGKGRDDLDYEILAEAQGILRKVTKQQSHAVRVLAEKIKATFQKIRQLLRKYEQNIEMVDPQLRNNPDLVQILVEYQSIWEKGKNYFLVPLKCKYLIHFSHIIQTTSEKYKQFKQQLQSRDADIFMSIPSLLILKSLDHEDKHICQFFLPDLKQETSKIFKIYKALEDQFTSWKLLHKQQYLYYNILQKQLIGIKVNQLELSKKKQHKAFQQMIKKIKLVSIQMQRCCPIQWNNLLDASLSLLEN